MLFHPGNTKLLNRFTVLSGRNISQKPEFCYSKSKYFNVLPSWFLLFYCKILLHLTQKCTSQYLISIITFVLNFCISIYNCDISILKREKKNRPIFSAANIPCSLVLFVILYFYSLFLLWYHFLKWLTWFYQVYEKFWNIVGMFKLDLTKRT